MSVTRRSLSSVVACVLALVVGASGVLAAPLSDLAAGLPRPQSVLAALAPAHGVLSALEADRAIDYGSDGRLTMLLLGSDYRPTLDGERTDVIVVMTINPQTRQMAAISIPRDVAEVRLPNGTTFVPRINEIYAHQRERLGTRPKALAELAAVVEFNLRIEIDYYALIRFNGFSALIDEVGFLTVETPRDIRDGGYWDDPNAPRGIFFPASPAWEIYGTTQPLCNGLYRVERFSGQPGYECRRALNYVRTRKGDSDFQRSRRHQRVVEAAIDRVVERGKVSLGSLLNAAITQVGRNDFVTDVPLTVGNALALYDLFEGATLPANRRLVLMPPTHLEPIPGTFKYRMKLDAIRELTRAWFAPVR